MPVADFTLFAAGCIVFAAAVVRGFSGFGFSLLAITALSFLYPLDQIVPAIFMMELVASVNLLPSIWRDIHWRSLGPLVAGCIIGTPFGVWLLSSVSPVLMQLGLSVFVLAAVYLMWTGLRLTEMPSRAATIASGLAAGLANGAFGIGGPPVIVFYFSSPAGAAAGRASLIAFFFVIDLIGLGYFAAMTEMITRDAIIRALIYLPPLVAGVWLGQRSFKGVEEARFRRVVLMLLAVMAVVIGVKAGFAM